MNVYYGCSWLVVHNWKNSSTKWQSSFRIKVLHGINIVSLRMKLVERSVLIIHSASWIFCLIISPLVSLPLWSAFGFLRKFLHSVTPPYYAYRISLRSVQDTTPCGVLSLCRCSLTLTLTISIGICYNAGATKSWSSVVSLSCSCRISLCIRSNYDSGGWATRIIHFSLLVFSAVSISMIRQETISLAIRNHSFRHPV